MKTLSYKILVLKLLHIPSVRQMLLKLQICRLTSGMVKYVKDNQPKKVMLVTECSMSDNVEADNPNVSFIKPCNLCPYMKKIDLKKILECLENETNEILLDEKSIEAARKSVIRMSEFGR